MAQEETNPKLDFLLLLGPGVKISRELFEAYANNPKSMILGDGQGCITSSHLNAIQHLVDSGTRIDIIAHGTTVRYNIFDSEKHLIMLLDSVRDTSEVLQILGEFTSSQPLEVHLWSCYTMGVKESSVQILGEGSLLFLHCRDVDKPPFIMISGSILQSLNIQTKFLEETRSSEPEDRRLDYNKVFQTAKIGFAFQGVIASHCGFSDDIYAQQYPAARQLMMPSLADYSDEKARAFLEDNTYLYRNLNLRFVNSDKVKGGESVPNAEVTNEQIQNFKRELLVKNVIYRRAAEFGEELDVIIGEKDSQEFCFDRLICYSSPHFISFLQFLKNKDPNLDLKDLFFSCNPKFYSIPKTHFFLVNAAKELGLYDGEIAEHSSRILMEKNESLLRSKSPHYVEFLKALSENGIDREGLISLLSDPTLLDTYMEEVYISFLTSSASSSGIDSDLISYITLIIQVNMFADKSSLLKKIVSLTEEMIKAKTAEARELVKSEIINLRDTFFKKYREKVAEDEFFPEKLLAESMGDEGHQNPEIAGGFNEKALCVLL